VNQIIEKHIYAVLTILPWEYCGPIPKMNCNCRTFPTLMPELSFMRIYSQRMRVPGSVIIDGEHLSLA